MRNIGVGTVAGGRSATILSAFSVLGAFSALGALAGCAPETAASAAATPAAEPAALSFAEGDSLVSEYCLGCHNYDDYAGGMELLLFEAEYAHEDPELAERIILKLRAGQMPPAGEPRPDFAEAQAFAASLENIVDSHSEPHPEWRGLHRLNRAEYANVVRDLIGLEIDPADYLPTDDSANGFDNQAGALGLSPVLLEAYLSAAGELSRLAIGESSTPTQTLYRVPEDATQNSHVEGLPFGTRGGIRIRHNFPVSGDYAFKIFSVNVGNMGNFRPFGQIRGEQLEVLVDGARVALLDWDEELGVGRGFGGGDDDDDQRGQLPTIDLTVPVTAGPHEIGVTFLASTYAPGLDLNNAFERSTIETGGIPGFTFFPHIGSVRIDGPYNAADAGARAPGAPDTPSRAKIFTCQPAAAAEERACAESILARLARTGYRGRVEDEDLDVLLAFYDEAAAAAPREQAFEAGVEAGLQRLLADPKLIYRIETPPAGVAAGEAYRVDDLALASRLSFFLWSSMPDEELLSLAEAGELSDPETFAAQVSRMLDDPRSWALTENFAGQWLALRNLEGHVPVVAEFPDFDNNLRQALRREVELFFANLVAENRPLTELLTADYTFVNERLATHYGIPGVKGSRFRRVDLAALGPEFDARHGLLGKGGLLTVTAQPGRTSPVIRGNWLLTNVLGAPAPDPPASVAAKVAAFDPTSADAAGNRAPQSMREQFEAHRADPACAGCHKLMDPIGFALEPFDATGHWRDEEGGLPINASDVLYDGSPVNGPGDVRDFVVRHQDRFVDAVAEKLMTYAVGRGMEFKDMPQVRAVASAAEARGLGFRDLVLAVAESDLFQESAAPELHAARDDELGATGSSAGER